MKINYKKLIIVSLLLLSMQQCFALAPDQHNEQAQQELQNLEFPQNSTEQYLYVVSSTEQPAGEGVIIEPVVISDKIVGNYFNNGKTRTLVTQETRDGKIITTTETWKTKNPSYLTARNVALVTGAVLLTYVGLSELTYAIRISYLKDKLQGINDPDYFNFGLIASLTQNFSDAELDDFIKTIYQEAANKDSAGSFRMNDIVNIYKHMESDDRIPNNNKNSMRIISKYLDGVCEQNFGKAFPFCQRGFADHEAGHALMMAVSNGESRVPLYGSLKLPYRLNPHIKPDWHTSQVQNLKREIAIDLAGGIAQLMLNGEEVSNVDELLKSRVGSGMKVDMDSAEEYARKYVRNNQSDFSGSKKSGDQFMQEWHDIMQEAFIDALDTLKANKDKLVQMSNELYEKEILSEIEIYDIAGTKKPIKEKSTPGLFQYKFW